MEVGVAYDDGALRSHVGAELAALDEGPWAVGSVLVDLDLDRLYLLKLLLEANREGMAGLKLRNVGSADGQERRLSSAPLFGLILALVLCLLSFLAFMNCSRQPFTRERFALIFLEQILLLTWIR